MNPLLLPLIAAQGLWVRARTERLPPASGDTRGSAGPVDERALRVGVLGESTAAGCGVSTHSEGFPGCLARILAQRTGRGIAWDVVGHNGATARRIRHRLMSRLPEDLDVAVLLAGVNDTLARRSPEEWAEDLSAIVDGLTERADYVAVVGIPPFTGPSSTSSALPTPLRGYLGRRAAVLDGESRRVCADRPKVGWISSADVAAADPRLFAQDRFHPSAEGYQLWAEIVARHVPG